jgi:exodeoxyribonuclease V beta subunit
MNQDSGVAVPTAGGAPSKAWDPETSLDEAHAWLLEASAGTGKTFQLGRLFVRLVVERAIEVRKILAITFTNAATAELRDRIRARLRETLDGIDATPRDAFVEGLVRSVGVDVARIRLELAIRDFDQAAISTIHGFAQRTLTELAFETGQDLDLELLSDDAAIREQLVDDAMATVYAALDADEVTQFQRAGWTRDNLLATAEAVCGPSVPTVLPAGVTMEDQRAALRTWLDARARILEWWSSPEALRHREALLDDKSELQGVRSNHLTGYLQKIELHLTSAKFAEVLFDSQKPQQLLRVRWFQGLWKANSPKGALESRPWWPLITELEAYCRDSETFLSTFAPVATFAHTARAKFQRELARRGQLTFDAMLSRLAEAIGPRASAAVLVRDQLRARYDAAFVDEFQDTDDAQWAVIKEAFHVEGKHLFLIGDPKQAIYGFRGADVNVYLEAARGLGAAARFTMKDNHRSDPAAVEAMNTLWREGSRCFDVKGIDYVSVSAKKPARLIDARQPARLDSPYPGLRLRWVDARVSGGSEGAPIGANEQRRVAALAAEEVHAWLDGERALLVEGEPGATATRKPRPGDLAVLVNSHNEAESVRVALAKRRIPSVAASKRTVFETSAAMWLASWLRAVASGGRAREARAAALTPIAGWTPRELAWSLEVAERGKQAQQPPTAQGVTRGKDRAWDTWTGRLRAAAERWKRHGFAHTLDRELAELGAWPRLLALPDGERHATDLRHLFELLHAEERARHLGPTSLGEWLATRAAEENDETAQRLESDANAVRVETVHASKGLEYPIVLLPFTWVVRKQDDKEYEPIALRSPSASEGGGQREEFRVDLHPPHSDVRKRVLEAARAEERAEALRKLYVALTRARHHTVAWWGPVGKYHQKTSATALGRLAMRQTPEAGFAPTDDIDFKDAATTTTPWERVVTRLDALMTSSAGRIAWEAAMPPGALRTWQDEERRAGAPDWPADRAIPAFSGRYGVSSYSSIAKKAAAADVDEKKRGEQNAQAAVTPAPQDDTNNAAVDGKKPSEVSDVPATLTLEAGRGTRFGSFVHEVFEHLDFPTRAPHADSPHATLEALLESLGARHGYAAGSRERAELVASLPGILHTPLGTTKANRGLPGLPADFTLAQLERADRLDELDFDLRLGAGTHYQRAAAAPADYEALVARPGCVDPEAIYEALEHASDDARLEPWLKHQRERRREKKALMGSIAGVLTGSIDLAFRVKGDGGAADRYFIADYKTNRIDATTPGHFEGPWLDWEMQKAGYLLQSLFYTVALHRHLRVRLAGYDYETHFGGSLYLFVRGMVGPQTPRCTKSGCALGVHALRWPRDVVVALDAALSPAATRATGASPAKKGSR